MSRLLDNLAAVRERIAVAAERSGRAASDVKLIAVTKYVDSDLARQLVEAGCHDLGEARPQELLSKADALRGLPVRWHLIGHLQRNKAKRVLPEVTLLHSGDSLRLLQELNSLAVQAERVVDLLLEVNISGDPAKHGFGPHELEPALPALGELTRLRIRGLMAMSGFHASLEEANFQFEQVRQLRDRLAVIAQPNMQFDELSMGMSDDLEAAIMAGATYVRVGSSLFEGLIA
ncbi:MAG TPA: YggS family pyridoxal phosphate-dependent enzyme [Pirellulaceae bacterium]|nr:YggS family pyridoxal phosphate-dependent enzyme [Pirellulaceae bacterium]